MWRVKESVHHAQLVREKVHFFQKEACGAFPELVRSDYLLLASWSAILAFFKNVAKVLGDQ